MPSLRPQRAFSNDCLDLIKRLTVLKTGKQADYFLYVHESPEVLTEQMHGLWKGGRLGWLYNTLWWAARILLNIDLLLKVSTNKNYLRVSTLKFTATDPQPYLDWDLSDESIKMLLTVNTASKIFKQHCCWHAKAQFSS